MHAYMVYTSRTFVSTYACMHACRHACVHACVHKRINVCLSVCLGGGSCARAVVVVGLDDVWKFGISCASIRSGGREYCKGALTEPLEEPLEDLQWSPEKEPFKGNPKP